MQLKPVHIPSCTSVPVCCQPDPEFAASTLHLFGFCEFLFFNLQVLLFPIQDSETDVELYSVTPDPSVNNPEVVVTAAAEGAADDDFIDNDSIDLDVLTPRTAERTQNQRPPLTLNDFIKAKESSSCGNNSVEGVKSIGTISSCCLNDLSLHADVNMFDSTLPGIQS